MSSEVRRGGGTTFAASWFSALLMLGGALLIVTRYVHALGSGTPLAISVVVALALATMLAVAMTRRGGESTPGVAARARAWRLGLSSDEQREVSRAVRQGMRLDDERLRASAVCLGQTLVGLDATWRRRERWRRVLVGSVLASAVVSGVALGFDDRQWPHVLSLAVDALLLGLAWLGTPLVSRLAERGRAAVAANEG